MSDFKRMSKKKVDKTTQLFTTGQIAEFCDVSVVTVWRWIQAGKLKSQVTPGRHHRVKRKELVEFLVSHRMTVPRELSK